MKCGSTVLHDVYVIILTHYQKEVWEILKTKIKSNMFNRHIDINTWDSEELLNSEDYWNNVRNIPKIRRIYADVIWSLDYHKDYYGVRKSEYFIIHEVKTGGFNIIDIFNKYRKYGYNRPRSIGFENDSSRWIFTQVFGQENQMFVWGQKEMCDQNEKHLPEISRQLSNRSLIRLLPLEWIEPLTEKVIDEMV